MSLLKKIIAEVGAVDEIGELVALFRISQLPTIVVEDNSDARIYRQWIEQHLLGTYKVGVIAVGGKDNLLELYNRRNEFADLPVVFVANRGMRLFSGIPENYADIIFTEGYSIENDIYSNSKDKIENLIHSDKRTEFWSVKESIIIWFASEVEKSPEGNSRWINPDLDDLVPTGQTKLDKALHLEALHFLKSEIIDDIRNEYRLKLPGKLLFEMVARFSNISFHGLFNTALVSYESTMGPKNLISKIKEKLDEQRSPSYRQTQSEQKTLSQVSVAQRTRPPSRDPIDKNKSITLYSDVDKLILDLTDHRPTVIVQHETGNNFDWWIEQLEKRLKSRELNRQLYEVPNILCIEGKDKFLSVYDIIHTEKGFSEVPVAFVGNREMWSFESIPKEYKDIIWTQGYSIENDLYIEANLESLLQPHETWKHRQVLNATIEWFAFEVEKFFDGKTPKMDVKLSQLVLPGQLELNKELSENPEFQPKPERIQYIKKDYKRRLPGNFLLQILARFLNARGRDFNFDAKPQNLQEIAFTMPSSIPILYDIIQKIERKLDYKIKRIPDLYETKRIPDLYKIKRIPDLGDPNTSQLNQPKTRVGDKIKAKVLKNDGIKVTVQLMTDNNEEITFERPYYPGQVGGEYKMKVISVDSTGRVKKVIP